MMERFSKSKNYSLLIHATGYLAREGENFAMISESEDLPVFLQMPNMQSTMTSQCMKCVVCQKRKQYNTIYSFLQIKPLLPK